MNFKKILSSRTNWTIIIMFFVGGIEAVTSFIPPDLLLPIQAFLAFLGMCFRSNPKVKFNE